MTFSTFNLPDVGEGLTEAEIVSWRVKVGDSIKINETLLDIETAKSIVEIPSPFAGIIETLHVPEGMLVPVGSALVTIDDGARTEQVTPVPATDAAAATDEDEDEEPPLVLVGTAPVAPAARRFRMSARAGADRPGDASPAASEISTHPNPNPLPRTLPPVRLLAKRLGVDLVALAKGSTALISRQDVVECAVTALPTLPAEGATASARETRVPIKGVRKAIATAMTTSAFTAPHVTEWLSIDVTATLELIAELKRDLRWTGIHVTPLLLVAKALLIAVRRYPGINSRWDDAAQEIVTMHYVNLGIAVASPRGLVVPTIKDAQCMDLATLAQALETMVVTARDGTLSPADMAEGTITITNIGALGVDCGTPILVPGQAAILALGAIREMPWVIEHDVVPRMVTQLAISFDHRVVDGELGSHFLTAVAEILNSPARALSYL